MTTIQPTKRSSSRSTPLVVDSGDGELRFTVRPVSGGLCLRRELRRPSAGLAVQVTVFPTDQAFRQWCDMDRLRFDSPIVYRELLRAAEAHFGANDASALAD